MQQAAKLPGTVAGVDILRNEVDVTILEKYE